MEDGAAAGATHRPGRLAPRPVRIAAGGCAALLVALLVAGLSADGGFHGTQGSPAGLRKA
jgi:hypothetical protein